jgi:hypothetical protein
MKTTIGARALRVAILAHPPRHTHGAVSRSLRIPVVDRRRNERGGVFRIAWRPSTAAAAAGIETD